MILNVVLITTVVLALFAIGLVGGLEAALPFATFGLIVLPILCRIPIGNIFELTGQRLIVVVLLALFFISPSRSGKPSPVKGLPLLILIIAQILWALVSTANSIGPGASTKKLLGEIFEYYCLYFVYVKSISSVQTIYRILYAMVSAIFFCCIFGAIDAYLHWKVLSLFPRGVGRIGEALGIGTAEESGVCSTFPHRILWGTALVLGIVITLHLIRLAEFRSKRVFLWIALLLMFLNIYKTVSRGPWLGLILSFIILLVFERRRILRPYVVIGVLTLTVLIARPGVFDTIRNLYGESFDVNWSNPKGMSVGYRFELRRVAQAALARSPGRMLWGYGMESFFDLNLEGELAGHVFPFLSCDSAWIELMVETGYVGLALIACLLFWPACLAWRDFMMLPDPDCFLSLIFFVCLSMYYFMMLGVDSYAWGQEGCMLWIIIAMSIVYGKIKEAELRNGEADRPALTVADVLVG